MNEEELVRLKELIAGATWTKTTYLQPHEYVKRSDYPELFQRIMDAVKYHGYEGQFRGHTYRYFNIDGYKYWHFQTILNREKLPDTEDASDG